MYPTASHLGVLCVCKNRCLENTISQWLVGRFQCIPLQSLQPLLELLRTKTLTCWRLLKHHEARVQRSSSLSIWGTQGILRHLNQGRAHGAAGATPSCLAETSGEKGPNLDGHAMRALYIPLYYSHYMNLPLYDIPDIIWHACLLGMATSCFCWYLCPSFVGTSCDFVCHSSTAWWIYTYRYICLLCMIVCI